MQYMKGIDAYQNNRPTAITLGKFDGLHQGHELLIERVEKHQLEDDVDGIVFAFDMRPFFLKLNQQPDFLLTNEEKAEKLKDRVKFFIDCPFDEKISSICAEDFIKDILVDKFHVRYVIVGTDFRFGYQAKGDYHMLQDYGKQYGFQVEVITKKYYEGREISSSLIKEKLKKGNKQLVNYLLGYEYLK